MTLFFRRLLVPISAILLIVGCAEPPNVKVMRESANDLFPVTMDDAYLAHLEHWTAEAARARLAESYERNGVALEARVSEPRLRSRYLDTQAGRLAVIEIAYTGSPIRVTRVTGLVNDELITVSCTSPEGAPYDVVSPDDECGRHVHETFLR